MPAGRFQVYAAKAKTRAAADCKMQIIFAFYQVGQTMQFARDWGANCTFGGSIHVRTLRIIKEITRRGLAS